MWAPDSAKAVPTEQFLVATGVGPGGGPHVKVFSGTGATEVASFFAFSSAFGGGVSVALGDLDNDNDLEVIVGAGPGGGPHVRVFTDRGVPIDKWSFFAYDSGFGGGVNVAVADVDGNGRAEILTAPAGGGGPHVKVWTVGLNSTTLRSEFFAYDPTFNGGVQLAGAYVDTSNNQGIVTGAGAGGGPHVKTFSSTNQPIGSWFAYDPAYRGGVSVSSFFENDDDVDEIVTGALTGRGHMRSFSLTGAPGDLTAYAFDAAVNTGVHVGSIDGDEDGPFVVGPYGAGPGVCSVEAVPPNCARADYLQGRDYDGAPTFQVLPYPGWTGGIRVTGALGFFDPTPPTTTTAPTTTSTSTTSTSTTSTSTTTSSTSTSTTSTTLT
jgi:hypothetical protein